MNNYPLNQFWGAIVDIRTTSGANYKGELLCYDNTGMNCFILKENVNKGKANFHVIMNHAISDINLSALPQQDEVDAPLPHYDIKVLEERERLALKDFQKRQQCIGVGVTKDAQDIFDFIYKTHHDCHWDGKTIVVLDVRIEPPYGSENCVGGQDKSHERIQNVLKQLPARLNKQARQRETHHSERTE